jgi:heat shock protein HslJ
MKKSIYIILIGLSIMACKTNGSNSKKEIFWVDSARVDCVGIGPMKCLQIKRTEDGSWENFYDTIEGFDYEPGYLYTLEVAINSLPKENLPADKSMLTYRLVNVVSKKPDPKIRLNDIWVATHINNSALDRSKKLPQIEMSLKKMQLMGTDGCNSIRCEINDLSENSISFGAMMGTKKMCPNMEVPNQFNNALAIVTSYNFKDLELSLYDQEGQEVLKFLRVD